MAKRTVKVSKVKTPDIPKLELTKEECRILIACPYIGSWVNESNYPGYNDVVDKIYKFVNRD